MDQGRVLEPHGDASEARVVPGGHAMQTFFDVDLGDDAQARTLRIARKDARHCLDVPGKQTRVEAGQQEGDRGGALRHLLRCTGRNDATFREQGDMRAPLRLGKIVRADDDACSPGSEASHRPATMR